MASSSDSVSVSWANEAGQRLQGRFTVVGEGAVCILCHGYCSSKNSALLLRIAKEVQERAKMSTLLFDFAGNGESEGGLCFANYHKEVKDLQSAVGFVRKTLKKEVCAVLGHSKGGNVVLLFASMFDGQIPLIINVAGRFDMKRGVEERFGATLMATVDKMGQAEVTAVTDSGKRVTYLLTKSDLNDRLTCDMSVIRNITLSEVLTVHGTQDQVIPMEDAQTISQLIRQHELFLVEGADHNFKAASHSDAAAKKVAAFISSTGR